MDISEYRRRVQEQLERAAEESPVIRDILEAPRGAGGAEAEARPAAAFRADDDLTRATHLITDRSADAQRRVAAVEAIGIDLARHDDLIDLALSILRDPSEPAVLRKSALQELRAASFRGPLFAPRRPEYLETLRALVDDPDRELREQILEVLAQEKDEYVQRRLLEGLRNPAGALVPPDKAVQFLGYDLHGDYYPLLREMVLHPPTPAAKREAVRMLGGDPGSRDLLKEVMTDRSEEPDVRSASAASLQALAPEEFVEIARRIVLDEGENTNVRAESISALDHFRGRVADDPTFIDSIRELERITSGELQRAASRFVERRKE